MAKKSRKSKKTSPKKRNSIISGKGKYSVTKSLAKAYGRRGKNMFKRLGSTVGGMLGNPMLGSMLGHTADVLSGKGDYTDNSSIITANSLFPGKSLTTADTPLFSKGRNSVVLSHREYIGDVVAGSGNPSAFSCNYYTISASSDVTFPWLSQLASNFQAYYFEGLVFEFVSTSGEYATTQALGQVIMAEQVDPNEANFVNKFEMENYYGAVSSKPSHCIALGCECSPSLIVGQGHLLTGPTIDPLHTLGTLAVATNAIAAASTVVGELWVTYKVHLFQPLLLATVGSSNLYSHYYSGSLPTGANPFAGATKDLSSTMAITFSGVTASLPVVPAGTYFLIQYWCHGSSTAITGFTSGSVAYQNCTLISDFDAFAQGYEGLANTTTTTDYGFSACIQSNANFAANLSFQLTGATLPGNNSPWWDLFVIQISKPNAIPI